MPLLAAIVGATLLLEDDDLVAALLLQHFRRDQCPGDQGTAGFGAVAAEQEHLAELDDVARLARNALDLDNVVRCHAILLAAHANDREHVSLSSLTLGLESRPRLGRLGRGQRKWRVLEARKARSRQAA